MNITEPSVDANSDEIVSKKSKIDLSPPATPPKRPAPEVMYLSMSAPPPPRHR